jgi:hypothetical protein
MGLKTRSDLDLDAGSVRAIVPYLEVLGARAKFTPVDYIVDHGHQWVGHQEGKNHMLWIQDRPVIWQVP